MARPEPITGSSRAFIGAGSWTYRSLLMRDSRTPPAERTRPAVDVTLVDDSHPSVGADLDGDVEQDAATADPPPGYTPL